MDKYLPSVQGLLFIIVIELAVIIGILSGTAGRKS